MSEKVKVKSLVSRRVVLIDNNLRFKRIWESKGAVRTIDFDVLEELMYQPGVLSIFENGILGIDDMSVKIRLGLEPEGATEPENIITLSDQEIEDLLKNKSLTDFKDVLNSVSKEQVIEIVNYAVEHEIADFPKSEVLKRMVGIDVISAIKVKRQDEEVLKEG